MPTELQVDQGMYAKGYRYKLLPQDNSFAPLYSKTLSGIGPLMRDYPDTRFNAITLNPIDCGNADDLNDLRAAKGKNWAEVTETDPERIDPPTETEIEIVREYLRKTPA